jgi:hypothetical protein
LVLLKALKSLLNVANLLGINGTPRAALQSELIHEINQDGEVMAGLRSGPSLTPGQKAGHPAAILRWAGSISVQANGIASPRVSLMPALEAHLVLPRNVEVVVVAEAGTQTGAKLGEWDIR